jgi:lipoyl(octanoyl) transferase
VSTPAEIWVVRCGEVPYAEAAAAQKEIESARQAGAIPDVLLLLEHPAVYTKGRRTQPGELPMGEDWYRMQGIDVTETDRGGLVTYHGPGQLVAYPIVSLRPYGDDVHAFVRGIERVMIETLAGLGIEAQCIKDLTGVWTAGDPPPQGSAEKIGSIGLHVNKGVTTHGLAINVNNDLQPFEWIVPCGIDGVRMTSVCREAGEQADLGTVFSSLAERYGEVFERAAVERTPEELATAAGLPALPGPAPAGSGSPATPAA